MDMIVYLADGTTRRFVQSETEAAATLATFMPLRVYASPTLIVGSGMSTTVLATKQISRIDFRTEDRLPIPPGANGGSVTVLSGESEFRERRNAIAEQGVQAVQVGSTFSGVISYEMVGGHMLYCQMEAMLSNMANVFTTLQQVFSQPVLAFELPGGGAVLVNPANLLGMNLYPGIEILPRGSVLAKVVE
ncbi:MAG: hypothetical protein GC151_10370 [Betaproteobacteria bacterium]|nr:hypothetical protein [Betaproteobacteria bacterium]